MIRCTFQGEARMDERNGGLRGREIQFQVDLLVKMLKFHKQNLTFGLHLSTSPHHSFSVFSFTVSFLSLFSLRSVFASRRSRAATSVSCSRG